MCIIDCELIANGDLSVTKKDAHIPKLIPYQPGMGIGDVDDLEACSPANCITKLHLLLLSQFSNSLNLLRHSSSRLYIKH